MSLVVAVGIRVLLCILFMPFSALDKMLNFEGAVKQAHEVFASDAVARALIAVGLAVEILMPLAIITGTADRLAAFVMAGYCGVTALLFKRWWEPGDFWAKGDSQARTLFWDFLKNFSLAGGFLLLAFGLQAGGFAAFLADPLASSHPYSGL